MLGYCVSAYMYLMMVHKPQVQALENSMEFIGNIKRAL